MQKILVRLCLTGAILICLSAAVAAKADVCQVDENGVACAASDSCPAVIERSEYKTELFAIEYPRICAMSDATVQERINAVLQGRVNEFINQAAQAAEENRNYPGGGKFTAKMEYQVHRQDVELLSLTLRTYRYTGGAHGSASLEGYTFSLKTGQLLKYADLFPLDDMARQQLNQRIEAQIRTRQIPIFEPFRGVGDDPGYYLKSDDHTVLVFQQYEIAPYSSGILEFEVTQ